MDINEEKAAVEKKAEELVAKAKGKTIEFWMKFRYYVIGIAAIIVLFIGLIYLGQWYASGKAREFTASLHNRFKQENQALYDNIAVNKSKIAELKAAAKIHSVEIAKLKKNREGDVINVINTKDPKQLASLYDNLVDGYSRPIDFGQ